MKCGLRSQDAGVNSRESDDMEVIITKGALAPQYESTGHDTLGWNSLPCISATSCGEVDIAVDRSIEDRIDGGL